MKKISIFGLLILIATVTVVGMINPVAAQDDPAILLKIAQNAQEQIRNNITDDSSDKIKELFKEGSNQVDALNEALRNNNSESAKSHFLSAMKIFKEISQMLTQDEPTRAEMASARIAIDDPTSDLLKLYRYTHNLKTISEAHHTQIDFTKLYDLFGVAREQIASKQFDDAHQTIRQINQIIDDIEKQLRDKAAQQESERAKKYAQNYLEQLDRLIESAKNQGVSDDIIKRLEDARERLSSASSPEDIIKEVRKIISIKDQFELTKNDRLESRIMQVEKTLQRLSQMEKVDPQMIQDAKETLLKIKRLMQASEFEQANDLLRNLADQLNTITKSLS